MTTVYETMRVMNGQVPLLERHLDRLRANSKAAELPQPGRVKEAIANAVVAGDDLQLRLTWDGVSLDVQRRPLPSLEPIDVCTVSVRHGGYRIKTTDRDLFERARREAQSAGADEGLLLTREGYVAEGTLFAVAWIDGETLRLPTLALDILPSVGRGRVLEVARSCGIPVAEGRYRRADLDGRAVFATTATRGVVRVAHLDGVEVPSDERIDRIARLFWPAGDSTAA